MPASLPTLNDVLLYLKNERIRRNITQTEVARRMEVPQPYLCRLELARASPTLDALRKYASALDLNLAISYSLTPCQDE